MIVVTGNATKCVGYNDERLIPFCAIIQRTPLGMPLHLLLGLPVGLPLGVPLGMLLMPIGMLRELP